MTLWPSHRNARAPRRDPERIIRAFLLTLERIAVRARTNADTSAAR